MSQPFQPDLGSLSSLSLITDLFLTINRPAPDAQPLASRGLSSAPDMRALTADEAETVRPIWTGAQVGDLVLPVVGSDGELTGARLWTQEGVRLAPRADSGLATRGAVLASDRARYYLSTSDCRAPAGWLIAEGEPDFVALCIFAAELERHSARDWCVLGVFSGAWSPEIGAAVAAGGAPVFIFTDLDTAGERYAGEIRASLGAAQEVNRWGGAGVAGEDVCDAFERGVFEIARFVSEVIPLARVMPAPPSDDAGRWAWSDASGWGESSTWVTARAAEIAWAAARTIPRAALDDVSLERARKWAEAKLDGVCAELQGISGDRERALRIMAPLMSLVAGGALDRGRVEGALVCAYVGGDKATRQDRKWQITTALKSGPGGRAREPLTLEDVAAKLAAEDAERARGRRGGAGSYTPAPRGEVLSTAAEAQEVQCEPVPFAFDADSTAHVNVRFLPRDLFQQIGDWQTVTIRSDQNTGKTEATIEAIRQAVARGWRVLILCHRQSLCRDTANRISVALGIDVRCYLDEQGQAFTVGKGEVLVLCVNSLSNFLTRSRHGENIKPDLVIIDESEQVGRHLFGKTIKDLTDVSDTAKTVLGGAQLMICLDADAGEITKDLINFAGRDEGVLIQNDWHKWGFNLDGSSTVYTLKDRTSTGRNQLAREFIDSVNGIKLGDAPAIAACTSKGYARVLAGLLAREHGFGSISEAVEAGLFILITSKNKDGEHAKNFLANAAGSVRKYRAIIHSPTLGSGVSIGSEVHRVFAFLTAIEGITGPDNVQLITRARKQKVPMIIWTESKEFSLLPRNRDEAQDQSNLLFDEVTEHTGKATCVSDYMRGQFRAGLAEKALDGGDAGALFSLGLTVAAETGRTGWNPAESTEATLKARGAEIVEVEGGKAVSAGEIASVRAEIQEDDVQAILCAPRLSDEELEANRPICTPAAEAATLRGDIERRLGEDITEDTARAEVTSGALYRGERLAGVGALAEGGDVGQLVARQDRAALAQSPAAIFDKRRHQGTQAGLMLEAFRIVGLECAVTNEGRGARPVPVTAEKLDAVRAFLWANREALTAFGITPPTGLTPTTEDIDDKMTNGMRGLALRWLNDKLTRLGFANPARLAIQRDLKGILAGVKPEDAQAHPELWQKLCEYVTEHASDIEALGHKVGGGDKKTLDLIKMLLKRPNPLRVCKTVRGRRTYALDCGAVVEAWRWASKPLAELRSKAARD